MKKLFAGIMTAVFCLPCITGINAYSATVEEGIEVARAYGYTEDEIQQALNQYYADPEDYTEDDIDYAIEKIKTSGRKIVVTVPYNPEAVTPVPETTTSTAETGNSDKKDSQENKPSSGSSQENSETGITLTAPDGTEFTRINKEEFIDLSYEQKLEYLSTFTEDFQQVIIDNLSPEEYRSMMKQLPAEQKAEVINDLAEATDKLGVKLTVEDISDDKVQVAMKDDSGNLVGVIKAGNTVENTGYDRRGIFALAGFMIMAAFAGIALVMNKFSVRKEAEQKNEQ